MTKKFNKMIKFEIFFLENGNYLEKWRDGQIPLRNSLWEIPNHGHKYLRDSSFLYEDDRNSLEV